jgi:hypothetical protein
VRPVLQLPHRGKTLFCALWNINSSEIAAPPEHRIFNTRHALRDSDRGQAKAPSERLSSNTLDAVADSNISQTATIERSLSNTRYPVGFTLVCDSRVKMSAGEVIFCIIKFYLGGGDRFVSQFANGELLCPDTEGAEGSRKSVKSRFISIVISFLRRKYTTKKHMCKKTEKYLQNT